MQHDLYSWQVIGKKFVYEKEITNGSKLIDKSIRTWLEQIEPKQRGEAIDIIFKIINETKVEKFPDLKEAWFANAKILFKSYRMLSAEDRKMVLETLSALIKIGKDNFVEEHPILKIKR